MTHFIGLFGRKGGIGKTTNAVTLAAACARAGLHTLLVDADGQGNAAKTMGVTAHDGMKALLIDDAEFGDVIVAVPQAFAGATVALISSSNGQRLVEKEATTPARIIERFAELRGVYDVVIFDTSPGITEVHAGVYYACDFALLPTLLEFTSLDGVRQTLDYLSEAQRVGGAAGLNAARVLGIVPNRFASSERIQQQNLGWLRGKYGDLFDVRDPVRNMTVWSQAAQKRRSIYTWQPEDDAYAQKRARAAAREFDETVTLPLFAAMGVTTNA